MAIVLGRFNLAVVVTELTVPELKHRCQGVFLVELGYVPVAQWIEQDGSNVKVGGSNPSRHTTVPKAQVVQ